MLSLKSLLKWLFVLMVFAVAAFLILKAYQTANQLSERLENRVNTIEGLAEKGYK